MKKRVKILILIFILSLFAVLLSGCNSFGGFDGGGTSESSTEEIELKNDPILLNGDTPYCIVRASKAEKEVISAASGLCNRLEKIAGRSVIKIIDDWVMEPEEADNDNFEILVGMTNRPESDTAKKALGTYLDYAVVVVGNKICIYANDTSRLKEAVDWFFDSLTSENGEVKYTGSYTHIDTYDKYKYGNLSFCGVPAGEFRIVIPASCTANEKELAAELETFIGVNGGAILETVTDAESPSAHEILIGATNRADLSSDTKDKAYFKTTDKDVILSASDAVGLLSAKNTLIDCISSSSGTVASGLVKELKTGGSIDGMKVAFIGNSMIYYGGVVTKGNTQDKDYGWFYEIAKANGDNITVYDCTYGDHALKDFTAEGCKRKVNGAPDGHGDLLDKIDLSDIDIVFFSEAGQNNSNLVTHVKSVMKRFTKPGVRFFYLTHTYSYTKNHTSLTGKLPELRKSGVTVVDWGHICYDIYSGNVKVPGGTLSYSKNTFVNKKSGDEHHPNPLAGYIQAQAAYCAATGRSAVGQVYSMRTMIKYGDGSVSYDAYRNKYYTDPSSTNFNEVFASESDMRGIQQLIDEYNRRWGCGPDN